MMKFYSKKQPISLNKESGFTIIELLVVMTIMGVLASIVLSTLKTANVITRYGVVQSDLRNIKLAIVVAQGEANKTLREITGSNFSAGPCYFGGPDLRNIPDTHQCFIDQTNALRSIQAANRGLIGLPDTFRDPWGSPYLFDENEGEGGGCGHDNIISVGPDGRFDDFSENSDDYRIIIPHQSVACR